MIYKLEVDDNKISFAEELFRSKPFVRIAPETEKQSSHVKSTTPRAGCMKGTFTWMSDDFNEPVDDFNQYQ
jgi:hypothetical protein